MQLKQHTCESWSDACLDNNKKKSPIVVAQLGQSLDGQIATATGQSKYINGLAGLEHLHQLRAWADVVVVGVGTMVADDPLLNVRLVQGADPHRVIIDPRGRTPMTSRTLALGDVRKVILTGQATTHLQPTISTEVVCLGEEDGSMNPVRIVKWLEAQGWSKILVEGGATTVTRFLEAGCLDYLHLIVSPVLLGEGTPGLRLPCVNDLSKVARFQTQIYPLREDRLIVCQF